MAYEAKDFSSLIGTPGFSDELLQNHFKLYEGYVANTNKLIEQISGIKNDSPEFAELNRRFGWEFNGMRLHELYFGNLTKEVTELNNDLPISAKIVERFGSYTAWETDFKATGAMRGIGWVVMSYDKTGDRLITSWVNEHDLGIPAGCVPLLVMDVFEHAFITEYGLKRAEYIEAFFKQIDWNEVNQRFEAVK